MKIMKLESCCCCSLRLGVLIIGTISLVLGIVVIVALPIIDSQVCSGDQMSAYRNLKCGKFRAQLGGNVSGQVIGIILSGLMIYGSEKEKYRLMLPMIILQAIGIAVTTIIVWIATIILLFHGVLGGGFLLTIFGNAILGSCVYLWLVVHSRCQELKNKPNRKAKTV